MSIPAVISPESMQAWARDLPYTNKALVGREAFEILQDLSGQPLSGGNRIAVLEALEYPVQLVLDHLQAQIIGEHSKAALFLSLGQEFCRLLETSYEQLHQDLIKSRNAFLRERPINKAISLRTKYLEQQLLFQYLDHQPTQAEIWGKLITLGFATRVKDRGPFYRAIALHLGIAYRLSPHTIRDVFRVLQRLPMEKLIDLKPAVTEAGQIGFFLATDGSPPLFGPIPVGARPLDLTRLVNDLSGSEKTSELTAQTVADLKTHWSANKRTKELRIAPQKPLATMARFGLSDILNFLANHDIPETDRGRILYQTVPGELPQDSFQQESKTAAVQIFDISDNGCRIRTSSSDLRSGEIVCIQWNREEKRIGSVAWFRKEGDARECGVQWLLDQPRAALVRFDSPTAVHALIGRSPETGQDILLYGSQHNRNSSVCWIKVHSEWQQHRLIVMKKKDLVEIAETFLIQSTIPPAVQQQVPPTRVEATPETQPETKPASPYQDVWDALSPSGQKNS